MLSGEKILITGPAGKIARPVAVELAKNNEVWGIARFSDPEARRDLEAAGLKTRKVDLLSCDFGDLPQDFTYLIHIAANFDSGSYDRAIQINAEGAGLLLQHCRKAKAALVMSTLSVYKPHPDPWHAFEEGDPLGDIMYRSPPSYSISKISEEAVARFCARAFNLPVTIARMGSAYGETGGLPVSHLRALVEGRTIETRWDPQPYSPIHVDDIVDQVEAMLNAATVPATIVNWCGDEPVSVQQWVPYMAGMLGLTPKVTIQPVPGASLGSVGDVTKRLSITGPCKVNWQDGVRRTVEALYPQLVKAR